MNEERYSKLLVVRGKLTGLETFIEGTFYYMTSLTPGLVRRRIHFIYDLKQEKRYRVLIEEDNDGA